jgi:xanthine dehydrogenase molybdenum-binding subunit
MSEFKYIGKSWRIDAVDKVTGAGKFMQDTQVSHMLHAAFKCSPHAHAKIRNIDTSKADAATGVRAVLTYKDVPPKVWAIQNEATNALVTMFFPNNLPAIRGFVISDNVVFMGQPVALVAADTLLQAYQALDLIEVEYEELPAVIDAEEAIKPGAPEVYPQDAPGNIIGKATREFGGDTEKGFQEADVIFSESFSTNRQWHSTLDTRGCVVWWEGNQNVTMITSHNVALFLTLPLISEILGIPSSGVRLIAPQYVGAFHGGRSHADVFYAIAASILSKKAQCPVRLLYSRENDRLAQARHGTKAQVKIGLKKDGTLTALDYHVILDCGSWSFAPWFGTYILSLADLTKCPCKIDISLVTTNKQPSGPFRGFAYFEAHVLVSEILSSVSRRLNLDVKDLFLKNCYWKVGERLHGYPATCSSSIFEPMLEASASDIGWGEPTGDIGQKTRSSKGLGFCIDHFYGMTRFPSTCVIYLREDGSVILNQGIVENGAGQKSTLIQIAAEALRELNVPLEKFRITTVDTLNTPFDAGQRGMRTTSSAGVATLRAAQDLLQRTLEIAAPMLRAAGPQDVGVADGFFFPKTDPSKRIPLATVAVFGNAVLGGIMGHGSYSHLENMGKFPTPAGVSGAEVMLDTETGLIRTKKIVVYNDYGRVIDPLRARSQIYGSIAGMQFITAEDIIVDDKGRTLNTNLISYPIPTMLDIPEFHVVLKEDPDPTGPFGAKGAGEHTLAIVATTLYNAVSNVLGNSFDPPATPDKLLRILGKVH